MDEQTEAAAPKITHFFPAFCDGHAKNSFVLE